MILQGVGHPVPYLGVWYANDPKKGGYMAYAPALDLTTLFEVIFPHQLCPHLNLSPNRTSCVRDTPDGVGRHFCKYGRSTLLRWKGPTTTGSRVMRSQQSCGQGRLVCAVLEGADGGECTCCVHIRQTLTDLPTVTTYVGSMDMNSRGNVHDTDGV